MKTLVLNTAQIAFMQTEVIAWLSMQEDDDQFASFATETPESLRQTADMLNLLAQIKEKPEAGAFTLSEDTVYSLLCYVEFDGEERAADPSENISLDDMMNYVDQLDAQPIDPEKMTIIRRELANDYYDSMTTDRDFRSGMADSYVASLTDDAVIEEWRNGMLDENSEAELEE